MALTTDQPIFRIGDIIEANDGVSFGDCKFVRIGRIIETYVDVEGKHALVEVLENFNPAGFESNRNELVDLEFFHPQNQSPYAQYNQMISPSYTPNLNWFLPSLPNSFAQGVTSKPKRKVSDKPKKKEVIKPKITFDSVILASDKKEQIKSAIAQIENNDLIFEQWGFAEVFEKGTAITLLFFGTPGTGKTLMAQAIAEELGAELKIYGTADIETSEPGGAERTIKKIFKEAKELFTGKKKLRVILFDECDSLLYDRNKVGVILGAQINTMLSEIENHNGIIIFTTNRMGKLDPALERRIAAKIEFPFPNREQRKAIWKRMIPSKAPLSKKGNNKIDFDKLSEYPLAGGNIKNVVLNVARQAAYEKAKEINMLHFINAIEKEAEALQAFATEYENQPTKHEDDAINQDEGGDLVVATGGK